jgi:hypothetical protein
MMQRTTWVPMMAMLLAGACIPIPDGHNDVELCPASLPSEGEFCVGSVACTYGPEACQCGRCNPAFGCQCVDGSWRCWHTDPLLCDDIIVDVESPEVFYDIDFDASYDVNPDAQPGCPSQAPIGIQMYCGEVRTCEYGTECCCGQCYASTVCTCNGEGWGCYATDACMVVSCPDVMEDVFTPDVSYDVNPDASQDVHYDAYEDVQLPWEVVDDGPRPDVTEVWTGDVPVPACCTKNADCGPGWSCGTAGDGNGTCKPALPYGECWSQEDCATGSTCQGASVCACNAACFIPDQSGKCITMPGGCCWVDGDCDAGQVCRAQGGGFGLPGSCVDDPRGAACMGDSACCWTDGDCPANTTCGNVAICGCIELCPMCGACMPDRMGTCG